MTESERMRTARSKMASIVHEITNVFNFLNSKLFCKRKKTLMMCGGVKVDDNLTVQLIRGLTLGYM